MGASTAAAAAAAASTEGVDLEAAARAALRAPDSFVLAENTDCNVCKEALLESVSHEVVRLACGHVSCSSCITRWLGVDCRCPVCRWPPARYTVYAFDVTAVAEGSAHYTRKGRDVRVVPRVASRVLEPEGDSAIARALAREGDGSGSDGSSSNSGGSSNDDGDDSDGSGSSSDRSENTWWKPCSSCLHTKPSKKLMQCDACRLETRHIGCLDPPLRKVPEGTWLCDGCTCMWESTGGAFPTKAAYAIYRSGEREAADGDAARLMAQEAGGAAQFPGGGGDGYVPGVPDC